MFSGGIFKCSRCGSNMVNIKSRGYEYYVCGSIKYRRGLSCGNGVYIPKQDLECDVLNGIKNTISTLVNSPRLTQKVNKELRRLSVSETKRDLSHRLKAVEGKIERLIRSIEDGSVTSEIVKNAFVNWRERRKNYREP